MKNISKLNYLQYIAGFTEDQLARMLHLKLENIICDYQRQYALIEISDSNCYFKKRLDVVYKVCLTFFKGKWKYIGPYSTVLIHPRFSLVDFLSAKKINFKAIKKGLKILYFIRINEGRY